MKNYYKLIYLYAAIAVGGGALTLFPSLSVGLLLPMTLLIPPCTLILLRRFTIPQSIALTAVLGAMCVVGMGSLGAGLVLAMLWYGGALILRIFSDKSLDLYPMLMYGGSLFLALIAASVIFYIKEYYGVWDIRAIYRVLENQLLRSYDQLSQLVRPYATEQQLGDLQTMIAAIKENIEAAVFQLLTTILVALCALYFWTLKMAQFWSKRLEKPVLSAPLPLFIIPRNVTIAYVIIVVITELFLPADYYFAANIANTLVGYLYVLVGIGFVDTLMHKKSMRFRNTVKTLLFLFCASGSLVYIILMVTGVAVSLTRRVFFRTKRRDQDE